MLHAAVQDRPGHFRDPIAPQAMRQSGVHREGFNNRSRRSPKRGIRFPFIDGFESRRPD
jgi:hypothetical protein